MSNMKVVSLDTRIVTRLRKWTYKTVVKIKSTKDSLCIDFCMNNPIPNELK